MYSSAFQTRFFHRSKQYESRSDCSKQSDLGPYCLQNRLAKYINRQAEQMTKVVIGWRRVNKC